MSSAQGPVSSSVQDANKDTQPGIAATQSVTGNIEFASLNAKRSIAKPKESQGGSQTLYKLIDFGTAVGIHEDESMPEQESMMTFTELEFAG